MLGKSGPTNMMPLLDMCWAWVKCHFGFGVFLNIYKQPLELFLPLLNLIVQFYVGTYVEKNYYFPSKNCRHTCICSTSPRRKNPPSGKKIFQSRDCPFWGTGWGFALLLLTFSRNQGQEAGQQGRLSPSQVSSFTDCEIATYVAVQVSVSCNKISQVISINFTNRD